MKNWLWAHARLYEGKKVRWYDWPESSYLVVRPAKRNIEICNDGEYGDWEGVYYIDPSECGWVLVECESS